MDCAKLAKTISNLKAKATLLSMAEAWVRLADHLDQREQDQPIENPGADDRSDQDANPE